jgi:glucose dehydrogenase
VSQPVTRGLVFLFLVGALIPVPLGAQGRGGRGRGGRGGAPAEPPSYTNWEHYGGSASSNQYSPLDIVNRSNVAGLEVVWTLPTGGNSTFSPIVIDGVMYTSVQGGILALDAGTGQEVWRNDDFGAGARGFNYWESDDGSDRRLVFLSGGMLTALDAGNGELITSFGENGQVDVRIGVDGEPSTTRGTTSNPGRIFEDIFIMPLPASGASYDSDPADIHAFSVITGEPVWEFHTVPRPGEFGADTWPAEWLENGGGVHNWSEMTVDEENGIAFIPTGTARYDFYGGNRHGDNLFANTLLALDARTGERIWHYQIIHHDLWDYDLPNAPKLLTIDRDGEEVDVVAQATKHGFLFVFERLTGEPIWPIEERPVPQSDVPGEQTSPTQPFPTAPPPFAHQSFVVEDINPFLPPDDQAEVRELLRTYRNEGLFTPPSFEGSISVPGHNGGANWGSVAANPEDGTVFVVTKEIPTVLRLTEPGAGGRGGRGGRGGAAPPPEDESFTRYNSPVAFMTRTNGLPALAPPWSHLTAYDLNEGTIRWQTANGGAAGYPDDVGASGTRGGPMVTAGGLLFVGTPADRKIRAYDVDNGEVLWEDDVFGSPGGVPASWEIGGRQFIAFPVADGNGGSFSIRGGPLPPPGPGQLRVYALPR